MEKYDNPLYVGNSGHCYAAEQNPYVTGNYIQNYVDICHAILYNKFRKAEVSVL